MATHVGIEFEFAISDLFCILPESPEDIGVWPLRKLLPSEFSNSFLMDENTYKRFQYLTRAAYRSKSKEEHYAIDDVWYESTPVIDPIFVVLSLGLIPRKRWMKALPKKGFLDVTEEANKILSSYRESKISFDEAFEYFSNLYVEVREEVFVYDYRESVIEKLSEDLSSLIGMPVVPQGDGPNDYDTWTLESEYLEDCNDIGGDAGEGFELVSPVFDSDRIFSVVLSVCNAFRELEKRYGLKTTKGCGLHVNVSDENVVLSEISLLHAALREEPDKMAKQFGRFNNGACRPISQKARKAIQKLAKDKIVSAHSLSNRRGILLTTQLIEAMIPGQKSNSFRFANKCKGNYVEYRFAGNKDYHKKINKILYHIKDLFVFHRTLYTYKQAAEDKEYARKLAEMIKDYKSPALLDERCIIESLSDIRDIVIS